MTRIVILGGGPGGYEAALVGASLGATVTVIDSEGVGGACVLTDCVPSKTLIATSETMTNLALAPGLGVRPHSLGSGPEPALPPVAWGISTGTDSGTRPLTPPEVVNVDAEQVYERVRDLAKAQSLDIERRLEREKVDVVHASGRLVGPHAVETSTGETFVGDVILIATGASPRDLPTARPDGERILTWRHLYDLKEIPEHLVVVGSGVTGAEFASAYRALGAEVTLVSSRERVLPGEDPDAARVIEDVFVRRGIEVLNRSRAASVRRIGDGVIVELTDGRTVTGSHALMAVGSVPRTKGLGLTDVGVRLGPGGHVNVDRMSRTSVPGVYAAGDCTGVLPLASVAAMQGRIAMWHALGEAVTPLRLGTVSSNIFTEPEIATVGVTQVMKDTGAVAAEVTTVPLSRNPRAKMMGIEDGFVKLFCRPGSGSVLGGVIVAPRASELILSISLAVEHGLTVDQIAHTFSIYPSLSGSITEAARVLRTRDFFAGFDNPE
ncbi:pyruvate/2-oxoglutarate dehydrogenase complex, dihydrolipoamide dehydrogenase component [Frankia casuarinae]|uniref:NAD(P)H dehydrogenase (quinone) n=1 Tax=Frankia casuarinae (strain DSM 45818 / CECT 9043 / HFP020203 / CcI3) TaxID=106370 RepID=Q2JF62_FRACC|nr:MULTISPECIES: NAD(P)H-quinone dehydrogenase [Frankia]ABD10080.1 pyridine nucleotide-disulphide oxidoreductase dimerisation region [Frankia casuarinae]ETA04104.1 pyruvate/2-oxoglutarate dehydrogenase complex, dihydrolipoamide dehydrogenase component [Frankia sp. CcI6]EYT94051.1 pyruvate/2-oxoglutarate dehydrogenase complex, dihydrolipoamide dehydrogenase component [Frankia casuarinae]KDA44676.1 pyruvate/2-oxoglutarate dehydrogenase complex, dihydrolipoamide dehydrogenase component [Frankia sp